MAPARTSTIALRTLLLVLFALTACSQPSVQPTQSATPAQSIGTESPSSTAGSSPTQTLTSAHMPRAQYTINAILDYAGKHLDVEQTITYPNQTGEILSDLLLAVEPNFWPNCFSLTRLSIDDAPVNTYTLDGQHLTIMLPQPLSPDTKLKVSLKYSLDLPEITPSDPNMQRPRIFGYNARQINLVNWYPFIVPYVPAQGWLLHDPWYYGEHLVYDMADYEVNLRPADAAINPIIASSGNAKPNGEWTRYTLNAGRTFALSASTEFKVASTTVGEVSVYSYYFPFYEKQGQAVLQATAEAVELFGEHLIPYPHISLSAVQANFNDGMEFDGLYFLSNGFYSTYDGTPQNYLTFIAVHETAHQWWFGLVANDQALQPWLDESLCTYSEHIYYETYYPDFVDWWWDYRVDYYAPEGWVDTIIYNGGGFRPYTNAVYLRGARFLEELRQRIGDEAFFAFLKDYTTQESGKRAAAQDFFAILSQHTSVEYSDILKTYFQNSS